jgi:hypothetical protein
MKHIILVITILFIQLGFALAQSDCVHSFKQIAENYNPEIILDSSKVPDVPIFDKVQREIILKAYRKNRKETEKYVMLILLKVYKAQLICCKMGFNLSDNGFARDYNTIVFLFIQFTKFCNIKSELECTYISSAIVYSWVSEHDQYLNYEPIKKELAEITLLDKNR